MTILMDWINPYSSLSITQTRLSGIAIKNDLFVAEKKKHFPVLDEHREQ